MNRRIEIQVGLTVIIAIVVTLWGVTWLKDLSLQRKVRTWHVTFPQTGGLGASDEVQVNGIRMGSVTHIALEGDHAAVDLGISSDIAITRDSKVSIRNVGLMGEHVIAVELVSTGQPYAAADTIVGLYELGMPEVMAKMGGPLASFDRVSASLDRIATKLEKDGDLEKTMRNFRETSDELNGAMKENRKLLHETLVNLNEVSKTSKALTTDREAQYKRMLDSAERSAKNAELLLARMDSLRAVAQGIANKADHGDGTMAKLLNDPKLYDDVRGSVKALQDVLVDLKKNPKKYINLRIF